MRIWIFIFFLSLGITVNAQQVISEGTAYEVRGKAIFKGGADVTSTLLKGEKDQIFKALKTQQKEAKDAEKARKRLEKAARKSEKAQKRAVKELKNKQKAQDNYSKASKRLEKNEAKYNKLKKRGKLSPNSEAKWLKKLEGYRKNLDKAKRNLNRS